MAPDYRKILENMIAAYKAELDRLPEEYVFARSVLIGRMNSYEAELRGLDQPPLPKG